MSELLTPNLFLYLAVGAVMFTIGTVGVLTRRNAIVVFMCVELMLNAVNLTLVTFSRYMSPESGNAADGSMFVFFVMCVAAAEAVVGLAIIISLFRNKADIDINQFNIFKW